MKKCLVIFVLLFVWNTPAVAKEIYMYNKLEHFDKRSKMTGGFGMVFDSGYEVKAGILYNIDNGDNNNYGFVIETKTPLGLENKKEEKKNDINVRDLSLT